MPDFSTGGEIYLPPRGDGAHHRDRPGQLPDPLALAVGPRRAHHRGLRDPLHHQDRRHHRPHRQALQRGQRCARSPTSATKPTSPVCASPSTSSAAWTREAHGQALSHHHAAGLVLLQLQRPGGRLSRVMGVRRSLSEWVAWRIQSTRRRVNFDLGKKSERLHLLHGLEAILLDIDKAIAIIRGTKLEAEVVPNLMRGFDIDETQAEFVAELSCATSTRMHPSTAPRISPSSRPRSPSWRRSSRTRTTSRRSSATSWPQSTRSTSCRAARAGSAVRRHRGEPGARGRGVPGHHHALARGATSRR